MGKGKLGLIAAVVLALVAGLAAGAAACFDVSICRDSDADATREFDAILQREAPSSDEEARIREMVRRLPELAARKGSMVWAARRGSHETAIVFLENGGDPNDRGDWWHETPLYWTVRHRDVPLAERLIQRGADPSVPVEVNMCPPDLFQLACESGSLEMVKLFVEHGAKIDAVKASVLHYAVQTGNFELVRYLLRGGADPCALDGRGFTPRRLLDVAAKTAIVNGNHPLEAEYRRIQEELRDWEREKARGAINMIWVALIIAVLVLLLVLLDYTKRKRRTQSGT